MARSKRPRLFAFSREIELSMADGWASPPERELLEQMVDAFIEVTRTRQLTPARLRPVVEACRHPSSNVRSLGVARLAVMAHYFEHARLAFEELAGAQEAGVRESACEAVPNAPDDLVFPLLETFLDDEQARVRQAAARVAALHPVDGLVHSLERALAREPDDHTLGLLNRAHTFQMNLEG